MSLTIIIYLRAQQGSISNSSIPQYSELKLLDLFEIVITIITLGTEFCFVDQGAYLGVKVEAAGAVEVEDLVDYGCIDIIQIYLDIYADTWSKQSQLLLKNSSTLRLPRLGSAVVTPSHCSRVSPSVAAREILPVDMRR